MKARKIFWIVAAVVAVTVVVAVAFGISWLTATPWTPLTLNEIHLFPDGTLIVLVNTHPALAYSYTNGIFEGQFQLSIFPRHIGNYETIFFLSTLYVRPEK